MSTRLVLLLAAGLAACGAGSESTGEGDSDLSTGDAAMLDLAAHATGSLYVTVTAKTASKVTDAVVAAAARGVPSRAIVVDGAHDPTWQIQQHLESSGVDTDVRASAPAEGVLAIADGTALVAHGASFTRETTSSIVSGFAKRFDDALAQGGPASAGALVAPETVKLHPMPESGDDRLAELLATARTSIDLSIYQLQERRMVTELVAADGRGVRVRVMLEPRTVGAQNFVQVSKELAAAGVAVTQTPPAFDAHHNVDHAKFCVIDDKELLYGTGNMVRSGLGGVTLGPYQNRDFWIEDGRAASVSAARALFDADLARKSTTGLDMSALVLTPDNADQKIGALIDGAQHRLFVYNQSLSDDDLTGRLVRAKQRGVDVHVLLGYQPGFGSSPPANDPALAKLTAAGATAQYLKSHYLHGKAIVADERAYLGSQNFTNGGLQVNREVGEIFDDADVVKTLAATFAKDEASPE